MQHNTKYGDQNLDKHFVQINIFVTFLCKKLSLLIQELSMKGSFAKTWRWTGKMNWQTKLFNDTSNNMEVWNKISKKKLSFEILRPISYSIKSFQVEYGIPN